MVLAETQKKEQQQYRHSTQPILIFKKILTYHLLMYSGLKSGERLVIA